MKIELKEILVRDLVEGYIDNQEDGVWGYGGKLNIRPAYQREFVYNDEKRNEVIQTIRKGFPLNIMYWFKNKDGNFELLDGQQRTISICRYVENDFSIKWDGYELSFHNLTDDRREKILNYKLMVYICEGTDEEVIDWFKIINIAGEVLTNQEILNAVHTGIWLTDAKRYFSKTNCAAYNLGKDYLKGSPIRQDFLETAIKWICDEKISIDKYMSLHQNDENAGELWQYFQNVISWIKIIFNNYRKEMKGIEWGFLYNKYKYADLNAAKIEERVKALMEDDDVSNKKGIYEYLLDGNEKHLNIRAFSDSMRRSAYERQNGVCPHCKKTFEIKDMEADHITPWSKGGKTVPENCQMLCKNCNRTKSGR